MATRHAERTRVERVLLRLMHWYDESAADERDDATDQVADRAQKSRNRLNELRQSAAKAGVRLSR